MKKFVIAILYLIAVLPGQLFSQRTVEIKDTAHLQSSQLKMVIANNETYGETHKAGYGGISELYVKADTGKNIFVPFYAGINYEHIFSGDSSSYKWNMYETRKAPMKLIRLSSSKAELRQEHTENWPLKTVMSFRLSGNAIDFVFTGVPFADKWAKHRYIGLFFASYINKPEVKGINFIGRRISSTEKDQMQWIYHLPEMHGVQANHQPSQFKWKPQLDSAAFPISLVSAFSDLEYAYPFYYGVTDDNVIIMMFDGNTKEGQFNFAQSPDGGGDDNPAWDFIYFRKKYRIGKAFSFRARVIVKKFEGKQDVIRLYEKWSGKKVNMR